MQPLPAPTDARQQELTVTASASSDLPPLFKGGSSVVFSSKLLSVGKPSKCFFRVQLLARTIVMDLEHGKHVVNDHLIAPRPENTTLSPYNHIHLYYTKHFMCLISFYSHGFSVRVIVINHFRCADAETG